jgi:hypothetical protein
MHTKNPKELRKDAGLSTSLMSRVLVNFPIKIYLTFVTAIVSIQYVMNDRGI